jgi:hypothetical protein
VPISEKEGEIEELFSGRMEFEPTAVAERLADFVEACVRVCVIRADVVAKGLLLFRRLYVLLDSNVSDKLGRLDGVCEGEEDKVTEGLPIEMERLSDSVDVEPMLPVTECGAVVDSKIESECEYCTLVLGVTLWRLVSVAVGVARRRIESVIVTAELGESVGVTTSDSDDWFVFVGDGTNVFVRLIENTRLSERVALSVNEGLSLETEGEAVPADFVSVDVNDSDADGVSESVTSSELVGDGVALWEEVIGELGDCVTVRERGSLDIDRLLDKEMVMEMLAVLVAVATSVSEDWRDDEGDGTRLRVFVFEFPGMVSEKVLLAFVTVSLCVAVFACVVEAVAVLAGDSTIVAVLEKRRERVTVTSAVGETELEVVKVIVFLVRVMRSDNVRLAETPPVWESEMGRIFVTLSCWVLVGSDRVFDRPVRLTSNVEEAVDERLGFVMIVLDASSFRLFESERDSDCDRPRNVWEIESESDWRRNETLSVGETV